MGFHNIRKHIYKIATIVVILMGAVSPAAAQEDVAALQKSSGQLLSEMIGKADNPTMLMFTASWCAPCHRMRNVTFKDEKVSVLLKKYNIVMLDIDTQFGLDMQKKYCDDRSVPVFVILDKHLNIIASQKGATDSPTEFASFLSIGIPEPEQQRLEDATSQQKLDIVTGESFHEAAAATISEDLLRSRWSIAPEAGAGLANIKYYPTHSGFSWYGGLSVRCTSYKHNTFETGIFYTPLIGIYLPVECTVRLFGGFNLGGGLIVSRNVGYDKRYIPFLSSSDLQASQTKLHNYDIGIEALASYQIKEFRIGVRASYGLVNQIDGDIINKAHNKRLSLFVAYDLFNF